MRRIIFILVLLTQGLLAQPGGQQPLDPQVQAAIEKGTQAYAAKNYRLAAEWFLNANQISDDPQYLVTAASALDQLPGLDDQADAANLYQRYIASSGSNPQLVANAKARLNVLTKTLVRLNIEVDGKLCEVYLDGKNIGSCVFKKEIFVRPGKHTVRAESGKDIAEEVQTELLSAGTSKRVYLVAPEATPAYLDFDVSFDDDPRSQDCKVYINGRKRGECPFKERVEIPTGKQITVKVLHPYSDEWKETYNLDKPEDVPVFVRSSYVAPPKLPDAKFGVFYRVDVAIPFRSGERVGHINALGFSAMPAQGLRIFANGLFSVESRYGGELGASYELGRGPARPYISASGVGLFADGFRPAVRGALGVRFLPDRAFHLFFSGGIIYNFSVPDVEVMGTDPIVEVEYEKLGILASGGFSIQF